MRFLLALALLPAAALVQNSSPPPHGVHEASGA